MVWCNSEVSAVVLFLYLNIYNRKEIVYNLEKETLETYLMGSEFKYFQNLKQLPLSSHPSNLQSALIVYCYSGKAKITVYDDVHWVGPQELIILLPGQYVSFNEPSDDFLTITMVISQAMFGDTLSGVPRFTPHFFFYMRSHFWYPQTDNDNRRMLNFFGLIKEKVESNDVYRHELVVHLVRYLYLELYNAYEKDSPTVNNRHESRKEEIANKFFGLIMKNFRENKDVAYYANKLYITPKYLTMVIKEVSGKSAKDWIIEYMLLEIKSLLKSTNLNIQEIAVKTNFSNQSSDWYFADRHVAVRISGSQYGVGYHLILPYTLCRNPAFRKWYLYLPFD